MRYTQIFSGSSHPHLADKICQRLGLDQAEAELGKFSNGETKVTLKTSIRDQDVFLVQSGSNHVNDDVMELLIMASACKSGSAKSVTAVMPYFPYSRQSKKKSHRGCITARMVANLLHEAGVNHVITIDLHASQMQGFFHCPVDNLVAEPIIAQWIRANIRDWRRAVVVSKNPGGTKRVTSLADVLKLDFGIVMTDRKRPGSNQLSMRNSMILEHGTSYSLNGSGPREIDRYGTHMMNGHTETPDANRDEHYEAPYDYTPSPILHASRHSRSPGSYEAAPTSRPPLPPSSVPNGLDRIQSVPPDMYSDSFDDEDDDDLDNHARDIVTSRLLHGHIVDEDLPMPSSSPSNSTILSHNPQAPPTPAETDDFLPDAMTSSFYSTLSSTHTHGNSTAATTPHRPASVIGLGGSADAAQSSDDEEEALINPRLESTVTLIGSVRDRPVILLDDMIDKSTSWIVAAETVVKRGGATAVYCFATHGLFGRDALKAMQECVYIDGIIVTDSVPISEEKVSWGPGAQQGTNKLHVLDVSRLLGEAIRRNHHGEPLDPLYFHYD